MLPSYRSYQIEDLIRGKIGKVDTVFLLIMAPLSWSIFRTIGILELLFMSMIIMYDFYHSMKAAQNITTNNTKKTKWMKCLHLFTHSYVIFCYMYSFNIVLTQNNAYNITDSQGCSIRISVNVVIFQTGKFNLYLLLITRLCASYSGSAHQYSMKLVIIPFYSSCALWYIYCWYIFVSSNTWYDIQYNASLIDSCEFIAHIIPMAAWHLSDLILSIILLILFLKPLHKLLKNSRTCAPNTTNKRFISLIVRTSVLTSWAIVSTFCSVLLYVVANSYVVLLLDNIINVISVILMKSQNRIIYETICGKCNECCLCLCCSYCNTSDEVKLSNVIQQNKSNSTVNSAESTNAGTSTTNKTIDMASNV
eukprot:74790_1